MEFCLSELFQYRAFPAPYMAWTLIYTLRRIQAPQTYILRLQQTPNDTNRRPQKPNEAVQGCAAVRVDMEWRLLVSVGVWWCLLVSYVVWRCEEGVWGVFQSVSECCFKHNMDVCTVSLRLRVYLSVMALYGAANAHIWKSLKGKIPRTWHFWNIKIPKPPYISSLKIIGL